MAAGAMVDAPSRFVKVAVAQMTSVDNVESNFVTCARLAQVCIVALYVSLSLARWIEYVFEMSEFDREEMANGGRAEMRETWSSVLPEIRYNGTFSFSDFESRNDF